jgi:hypothetical protein
VLKKDGVTYTPFARVPLRTDQWICEAFDLELGKAPNQYPSGFHMCEKEPDAEALATFILNGRTGAIPRGWTVTVIPTILRKVAAEGYQYGVQVLVGREIFCFGEMQSFNNFDIDDWSELVTA